MRRKIPALLAVLLWASAGFGQAQAADFRVEAAEALTSDQVPASVREALQPKGVRLLEGDTLLFELWLPAAVPVKVPAAGRATSYTERLRKAPGSGSSILPVRAPIFAGSASGPATIVFAMGTSSRTETIWA